jgi:hypothetical protein
MIIFFKVNLARKKLQNLFLYINPQVMNFNTNIVIVHKETNSLGDDQSSYVLKQCHRILGKCRVFVL